MAIFSHIKNRVRVARLKTKAIAAGFTVVIAGIAAAATLAGASAITVTQGTDCNSNAVVWCGAKDASTLAGIYHKNGGDGHNTSASIQWIYAEDGINGSAIDNLKTTAVNGYVTNTGDVYATIGGKDTLVATDAVTGGRQELFDQSGKPKAGQTKHVSPDGKTTFWSRKPAVSFKAGVQALSAMVSMKNGVFQFAILNSCGNPVTATPKKPSYSITKQVSAGSSFAASVSVKSGAAVKYQIAVKSTGAVPVNNVLVRDTLPTKDLAVDKSSLRQDGKTVSSTEISQFFGTGYTIPTIKNGDTVTFTFSATKAGNADFSADNCAAETINNTASISTAGLSGQSSTATVKTTCATPTLACVSLKPAVIGKADQTTGEQTYTFTATASETRISSLTYTFNYGDSSKNDVITGNATSVTTKTAHNFKPGNHTVTVTVSGKDSAGQSLSKNCTYSFTVSQPTPGTLSCTSLTDTKGDTNTTTGQTQYTFKAVASASTNAVITGYAYSFDGGAAVAGDTTTTHDFAPGNHTVQVTVKGTDKTTNKAITATSASCKVTLTAPSLHPAYSIQKLVASSANGSFQSDLPNMPSGSTVYYKIVVKSTGDAPVNNVVVSDKADTDVHYTTGTLQQDGKTADATAFFGKGITIASIKNGDSVTFTFTATVGNTSTDTDASCKAETVTNTGSIMATGLSGQNSKATVDTTCRSLVGSLACTLLTAIPGDTDVATGNQAYSFSGKAGATNAKITGYSFVVTDKSTGKTVVTLPGKLSTDTLSATTDQKSFAPGTYGVVLTVSGTDNQGKAITAAANADCVKEFTVQPPTQFAYVCDSLTLDINNATHTAHVKTFNAHTTDTAAKLTGVTLDWGEGSATTTVNADQATVQSHTYGVNTTNATVVATAVFTLADGTTKPVTSNACAQPVSFTAQTPPPVLPNTGAGDVIGIFIGTVVTATIGFRLYTVRKLNRS